MPLEDECPQLFAFTLFGCIMVAKALSVQPTVDPTAKLHEIRLGAYCEVGARTILH